jgi:hypothetical protein
VWYPALLHTFLAALDGNSHGPESLCASLAYRGSHFPLHALPGGEQLILYIAQCWILLNGNMLKQLL